MKKLLLLVFLSFSVALYAQKRKVELFFAQEDVSVLLNGKYLSANPKRVNIDFYLGGEITFIKRGFYTQRVEIDEETIFSKLKIDLEKKPKASVVTAPKKRLLNPDTLLISEVITNINEHDVEELLYKNFEKYNYYIGKDAALFPDAVHEIEKSRYKLAVQILNTSSETNVYTAPRFMMAYAEIRWSLLDTKTNKVVYFKTTEGHYLVRIKSTKGLRVAQQKAKVMKSAMKEAQFKLLTDNEFLKLVMED